MNNVFSRLFRVLKNSNGNPHEDFLTELFAEYLAAHETMVDFIQQFLEISIHNMNHLNVHTQVTYPALSHHQTDSRPDIVVRFNDGQKHYVIFIESKLGSSEGFEQLPRYADHLNVLSNQGFYCYLIYLTKYWDDKDAVPILRNRTTLQFIQLRWHQLYRWMNQTNEQSDFSTKLLEYMGEIGLKDNRQFTPLDVYGIQQMNRLQRMMDECMDGAIDEEMTRLFGKALQQYNRYNQLKHMDRYVKASEQEGRATEVGVGFYTGDADYPIVSVVYEFNRRRCADYPLVVAAMQDFVISHPGWETFYLNSDEEWQGISFDRSLVEFLHHEDHISEIQKFFIEKLRELHEIKVKHPNLYWK